MNIAELPLGFDKVIHELSTKIEYLDEVFKERGLKSLVSLLPKLEEYDDPLNLDSEMFDNFVHYVTSINHLFQKYEEGAAAVAISETINFVEKLFPFIHPNLSTHKETIQSLKEVCQEDNYSALSLKRLLGEYGDRFFTLAEGRTTSLNTFLAESYPELVDMAQEASDIT